MFWITVVCHIFTDVGLIHKVTDFQSVIQTFWWLFFEYFDDFI